MIDEELLEATKKLVQKWNEIKDRDKKNKSGPAALLSVDETIARAILEMYATCYSEGQLPENATVLLEFTRKHFPDMAKDYAYLE